MIGLHKITVIPLLVVLAARVLVLGRSLQCARPRCRRGRLGGGALHAHPRLRGQDRRGSEAKDKEGGRKCDRAHFPDFSMQTFFCVNLDLIFGESLANWRAIAAKAAICGINALFMAR